MSDGLLNFVGHAGRQTPNGRLACLAVKDVGQLGPCVDGAKVRVGSDDGGEGW